MNQFIIEGTTLLKYTGRDQSVVVPHGITRIENYAFLACDSLHEIRLPSALVEIGRGAFQACKNIRSLQLPKNVEVIESSAFSGCSSLKELTIPKGIRTIENHLCYRCDSLKRVNLPDELRLIDWGAFYDCKKLKNVSLPRKLERIGAEAFGHCEAFTEIDLPDSVCVVENGAFMNCRNVKSIRLSENLAAVTPSAFCGCAVKEVVLPKSVSRIDFTAFEDCSNLELIIINGEHVNVTGYGTDYENMPTDAPIFFRTPRSFSGRLRRNMLRGYAKMWLRGETTPELDDFNGKYIKSRNANVCMAALADEEVLEMLMQRRLIPANVAEELIHTLVVDGHSDQVMVLLNYLGILQSELLGDDPMKEFLLTDL